MSNDFGYDPKFPENIREIFMWLCQDVALLQEKWSFYLGLFGDEGTAELVSELAPASFRIIEESLRDAMTMAICRLADPAQSGRKDERQDNLSLDTLVQLLEESGNVAELLKDFQEACKPVRQIRNKRVGHNDLNTTIKPQDNPLLGIGRKHIDRITQLAQQILQVVNQRFDNSELIFEPLDIGVAHDLIYWLKEAKEYENKKRQADLGYAAEKN